MDFFSDSKLNSIYLVASKSSCGSSQGSGAENILLIQKTLHLSVDPKQIKIVRILIYIPKNFPNVAPKFFLERAENHSIVEVQNDINKSTYEFSLKSISEWKGIGDFNRILSDITSSFNRIYPLYKLEIHKRKGLFYPENSFVPPNALKISLDGAEQQNNIVNPNIQPIGPIMPIDIKSQEEKTSFTDEAIKKIQVEHTLLGIKEKFLKVYYENKKNKAVVDEIKININQKIKEISDKIVEGKKIINAFQMLQRELSNEIANIKDGIIHNTRIHLSFETFRDFIVIPLKEEHLMKLISIESTLEDFIFSLKKSFEKNVLSFDETMRYIRKISKEIFVISFLKKKLIEEYK